VTQLRKLGRQVSFTHAASQISQNVADCNASATDRGLPETDLRIEYDPVALVSGQVHTLETTEGKSRGQA
jgi:hypothetical protein